jgi:hypothetical protein
MLGYPMRSIGFLPAIAAFAALAERPASFGSERESPGGGGWRAEVVDHEFECLVVLF